MHEGMINEQGDVVDVSLQRMSRERMADNIRMLEHFVKSRQIFFPIMSWVVRNSVLHGRTPDPETVLC